MMIELTGGQQIEWVEAALQKDGPRRVIVDKSGQATSPKQAQKMGVYYEIVFIRNDGWTLGAPVELESDAIALWKERWVAYWRPCDPIARPMTEYRQGRIG